MTTKRALLFANGKLARAKWLQPFITDEDYLIAVDGGLNHLERINRLPKLLIGDLDSVTPAQVARAKAHRVEVRQFPVAKDETDLELALLAAHEMGYRELVLIAALGGRLDQTLGNLSLLLLPVLRDCFVHFEDGNDEVFLIRDAAKINGHKGETVSLIPFWGTVEGVVTTNLAYPLNKESLSPDHTRGISNVMTSALASISIASGNLLCIHTHSKSISRRNT